MNGLAGVSLNDGDNGLALETTQARTARHVEDCHLDKGLNTHTITIKTIPTIRCGTCLFQFAVRLTKNDPALYSSDLDRNCS
jgi:hypothetical protein